MKVISIRLDKMTLELISKISEYLEMSRSDVIRKMITYFLYTSIMNSDSKSLSDLREEYSKLTREELKTRFNVRSLAKKLS